MSALAWVAAGAAAAGACALAVHNERRARARILDAVQDNVPATWDAVDLAALDALPPPVVRYFRKALRDGQPLIRSAELRQRGFLRTSVQASNWIGFTARELAVPPACAFVWDARVRLPLGMHLRVLDAYADGAGSGRLSFLSAVPVGGAANVPELNSGALHRYLAEAVWFPTALLPQSGVRWTAVDERVAIATLACGGSSVALTFQFNEADEVSRVVTARRWGRFDGRYERQPWEGHFRDYCRQDGMWVPRYGQVGWYRGDALELVWKGEVESFLFR